MLTYYRPVFVDGMIYSLDNFRFTFKFYDQEKAQAFVSGLHDFDMCMTYYPSFKDFQYRHLFNFGVPGFSFTLAVGLNSNRTGDLLTGYLDVNTNKILADVIYRNGTLESLTSLDLSTYDFIPCEDSPFPTKKDLWHEVSNAFYRVCRRLGKVCEDIKLRRYDLAVDVPQARSDVQLLKDRRKYSQFYKSELDFTEYLGSASSQGRVKVYNKALEAGLDSPLTRIELTMEDKTFPALLKQWPQVYTRSEYDLSQEKLVVQLLRALPASDMDFYLRRISNRQTKAKYKSLLLSHPFEPSRSAWERIEPQLSDCLNFFLEL